MTNTSARMLDDDIKSGFFNYLDNSVRPSLYRNGEVLTRRDPDGSDGGSKGISLEVAGDDRPQRASVDGG